MKDVLLSLGQVTGKAAGIDGLVAAVLGWSAGQLSDPNSIPRALAVLLVMIVLDWFTGIRANHYAEKAPIESAKLSRTADKAGARAIYVLVFWLLAHQIPGLVPYRTSIVLALVFYFTLCEAWSIFENLDRLRVPIPKWIKKRLQKAIHDLDNGPEVDAKLTKDWKPLG